MSLPVIYMSRDEMRKRVAYFDELEGFDGGLPDSDYPSARRTLYNAIGYQMPETDSEAVTSPLGAEAAANARIKISEGFNMGFVEAVPGCGPMMHNHDTNETFMPVTGRWRCEWEAEEGKVESFELGPKDIISFPAGVNRRFENITHDEPGKKHLLLVVVAGNAPIAEFAESSMKTLKAEGYV